MCTSGRDGPFSAWTPAVASHHPKPHVLNLFCIFKVAGNQGLQPCTEISYQGTGTSLAAAEVMDEGLGGTLNARLTAPQVPATNPFLCPQPFL